MYGSVGEVERRVSRSTMSGLVMSVRLGVMFGMWPWALANVVFCGEVQSFAELRLTHAAGRVN